MTLAARVQLRLILLLMKMIPPTPPSNPSVNIEPSEPDELTLVDGTATLNLTASADNFDGDVAYTWESFSGGSSVTGGSFAPANVTFTPNGSTEAANTTATFTEGRDVYHCCNCGR